MARQAKPPSMRLDTVSSFPAHTVQAGQRQQHAHHLGHGGQEEVEVDVTTQGSHVQAQAVVDHRHHSPNK